MISKTAWGIAAGAATLFIGYCIYFDRKRHQDPDFKKKLLERKSFDKFFGRIVNFGFSGRKAKKDSANMKRRPANFPNMQDHEAVQRFFLQEVQAGEELLAAGDLDNGVNHLANAVAVCGQPDELLQVLQQTLQPQVFHLLVQRLPLIAPRILRQGRQMQEEDVE